MRPRARVLLLASAVALALLGPAVARAGAEVRILNGNLPGEGFNDPTPATPVGGNPGTTLGEQRRIAFQYAATLWAATLGNQVRIVIDASFEKLPCSASGAVLGRAGPTEIYGGGLYPSALANELAGEDKNAALAEIEAKFNSDLDTGACPSAGGSWYYGFDTPPSAYSLVSTLQHEFGHGLGFTQTKSFRQNALSARDGVLLSTSDGSADASNPDLTIPLNVRWQGPAVFAAAPRFLEKDGVLTVSGVGSFPVARAQFGPTAMPSLTNVPLVLATSRTDGTVHDACAPIQPATDKLVLAERDAACKVIDRAAYAQDAGARGLVVRHDQAGQGAIAYVGDAGTVLAGFPVWGISSENGATVESALSSPRTASLDAGARTAGADEGGRVLLYTPSTYSQGSTLYHWDSSAAPDLLMEYAIGLGSKLGLDLTPAALRDVGWENLPTGLGLGATKLARPDVAFGQDASFLVVVVNHGTAPATGVVVDHTPDPAYGFQAVTGCTNDAFPCALGTVEPEGVRVVVARYRLSGTPTTTNQTYAITAGTPAPPARDATVTVASSHLAVTATGPTGADPNTTGTYTLTLKNEGQDTLQGVTVGSTVSGPATLQGVSGACSGSDGNCRITTPLGPGQTRTWTLSVRYTGPGTVTVTSGTPGATPGSADQPVVTTQVAQGLGTKSGCSAAPGTAGAGLVPVAVLALLCLRRRRAGVADVTSG